MTREEIDKKHLDQANALEAEFFNIVDQGLPSQHRVLKAGKSIDDFNQRHGQIWRAHEAELIAEGHRPPLPEPPPDRLDKFKEAIMLASNLADLKDRIKEI